MAREEYKEMTREEYKAWARENNVVGLVAELVAADIYIDDALRYVWDMKNLTKDEFKAKYFG